MLELTTAWAYTGMLMVALCRRCKGRDFARSAALREFTAEMKSAGGTPAPHKPAAIDDPTSAAPKRY